MVGSYPVIGQRTTGIMKDQIMGDDCQPYRLDDVFAEVELLSEEQIAVHEEEHGNASG